jgi:hypothetical protein
MKHTRYLSFSLCCLLLILPALVIAKQGKAPWYQVEIILFSRDGGNAGGGEQWPLDPGAPDWDGAWQLSRDGYSRGNYPLLPRSSWKLGPEAYALKRKSGFSPLIHVAWRQPVPGRNRAHPIHISSERKTANGKPVMEGLARVSIARFLHLDLDFLLRRQPLQNAGNADAVVPGTIQSYRFIAHRRMRSKELHYIDHPLMGALVLITPIELAAAAGEETAVPADAATGTKPGS